MIGTSFDDSLRRLLAHEGGYSNHPSDPGGPTNFGVTIADYRRYAKPNATAADVMVMRVEEAATIYREKYWDALACNALPAGVDYALFDYCVNSGVGRAGKVLRRLVGLPDDDWHVTDAVLAYARARSPAALIDAMCAERLAFLKRLKTWPVFGAGWGRRVAEVKVVALSMAANAARAATQDAPSPLPHASPAPASGKAEIPLPKKTEKVIKGAGGASLAGIVAAANAWALAHPFETLALAIVGVAAIAAGLSALDRWHKRRQEAAMPGFGALPAIH
jgi:lysozyme family protein